MSWLHTLHWHPIIELNIWWRHVIFEMYNNQRKLGQCCSSSLLWQLCIKVSCQSNVLNQTKVLLSKDVWVTAWNVTEVKMEESFKIVIKTLVIKPASQSLKTVSLLLILSELNILHLFSWGEIVARGCSTKRPMLYVECEAHKSKNVLEEFCYCSYDLCNATSSSETFSVSKFVLIWFSIIFFVSFWILWLYLLNSVDTYVAN